MSHGLMDGLNADGDAEWPRWREVGGCRIAGGEIGNKRLQVVCKDGTFFQAGGSVRRTMGRPTSHDGTQAAVATMEFTQKQKNKVVCICFGWRTRAVEAGAVWDGRGGDNFCSVGCDDEFARWRSPWSPMDGFACLAAGRRVCDEGKESLRVPSLRDRCEPVGPASPKQPQPSSKKGLAQTLPSRGPSFLWR